MSAARSPGAELRLFSLGQAALGAYLYRRELHEIAAEGVVATVRHRTPRAAALWSIGAAIPGWFVGRLADVAAAGEDRETVRRVGATGLCAAVAGAVLMPRSLFWLQALICARIIAVVAELPEPWLTPGGEPTG